MSASDGEARVVQISPRLPQASVPAYCPLQIGAGDTARAVISNAVVTLGLDASRTYNLLEVRKRNQEEKLTLEAGDSPLQRVLLWPKEAQRWHPESQGYFFILEEAKNGDLQVESGNEAYDDLCDLPTLTEDSILEALRQRFHQHKIYTYARNILLALNPNKFLPLYYNPKYVKMYENQPLGKLSPHIFAMANLAYRAMLNRKVDQCIVLSGESGSGKTESGSYLVHCLTALSQQTYSTGIERTVLGASPVLEAFGNAKTQENDNSSRFGKFIQLNYLESGVIRGAVIRKYLLEKCRLVGRNKRERNYHVFYYLLVGASKEEQEEFRLLAPQDYVYLKQEDLLLDDEAKLGHEYKRLHQAMEMVGFLPSTKKHIFSTLSAILLLGNVSFTLSEDSGALEVGPADVLSTLSQLLKVEKELLVKTLTERRLSTNSGTVFSQHTRPEEATSARDSMAKSLYGALFDWIVLHINHALLNRRDMEESVCCLSIGVLDLFGLENLHPNSFEQLCMNYSSEKLQCFINQQIFKLQQEDYVSEGIGCQSFDYSDNSGCIQLIRDGIFSILDEESHLPQSSDEALLDKLKLRLKDDSLFAASTDSFVVQHFAGSVQYCVKGFRQKNTDHMQPEVACLLRSSERSFLHHLVTSSPEALFRWGVLRATFRILAVFKSLGSKYAEKMASQRSSRKSLKDMKPRLSSNTCTLDFSFDRSDEHPLDVFEDIFANFEKRKKTRAGRRKQLIPKNLMNLRSLQHVVGLDHNQSRKSASHRVPPVSSATVCAQFQMSLTELMDTLAKAETFFIFCVRSNAQKKKLHFDDELVCRQIRYTGILQMVLVQKSGYTAKYTFKEFVEKFRMLLPKEATPSPEHITKLFARIGLDRSTYQIGHTKVFLKERERQLLQDTLNKEVMHHIIVLQRWFRTCLMRMHFLQKRDASLIIQRNWREFSGNRNKAASVIQTAWRTSLKRSEKRAETPDAENSTKGRRGRVRLSGKELRRQGKVDLSPNRSEQTDPVNGESAAKGTERREGQGSPPNLGRPFSVPLDSKMGSDDSGAGSPKSSSLQRYKDGRAFKEKHEKWRGRTSEESSPEVHRQRDKRKDSFQQKGKSMSADELSRISSSGSDSSPSASEIPSEPDGSRYSLPATRPNDESIVQRSNQSHLTTPDKIWFLSRLLRKRPTKATAISETPSEDRAITLPRYTPLTYHLPDQHSARVTRNPTIKISRATRGLQWNASLEREITNPKELRNLDEFLGNQVNDLRTRIKELSQTEDIFLTATMQFRETLKGMFSVQKPQIHYKDLMKGYQNKVTSLAGPKQKNEVSLVVNLFQSMLDGFIRGEMKRLDSEPVKASKTTKKRRKKDKCPDGPLDHRFSTYQVNIMQSCDLCGSYIWGMEKAYMCSACKVICHKKCLTKIITDCSTRCALQDDSVSGALHFGVHVCVLTSKTNPVPTVVELLLLHLEMNGLYTEGLYRKSGSACRARELHQIMEMDPEAACLENYPIHTIAGLLKRWLRELPDPLMTFCLYKDFLHAVELPERSERIRAVYQKVDDLPLANYNTLERLIFHLVRVANEEDHNKMSPNSLAIVFAPCILRSPDSDDPFLGMKDVGKTTMCVEILISEQLRRYKEKLQNIQELEYAEALAVNQLKLKRQNTVVEKPSELNIPDQTDSEEITLIDRIKSIKQEKLDLACRLPDLEQENSDNEILDSSSSMSTESLDDRLGSLDSEGH
ncbi:unconventional myosin-IXb isoform X2 [Nerophis ophidion]|uniref:unconventional myosin-IXb isoform X2 n=1 Tax=Nerophis ophidion TaxID=159077 RepID=UPI002ADFD6CE|nr:unconventional myosin-IXb isoform X2 [Nerophis ophidion]